MERQENKALTKLFACKIHHHRREILRFVFKMVISCFQCHPAFMIMDKQLFSVLAIKRGIACFFQFVIVVSIKVHFFYL